MKVYIVGIGPGNPHEITPRAQQAILDSDVVAGYPLYLKQIGHLLGGKEIVSTGMKGEIERCQAAVDRAVAGKKVCVISGGDAGVYGMAGLVHELAEPYPDLEMETIPGVTAATAASAALGAALGHDFAAVSLSDLLTGWPLIQRRIRAACEADYVLCLYNPASRNRQDYLERACKQILEIRLPETPCGIARNVGREGQSVQVLTLEELKSTAVDMFCTVIIGNTQTRVIHGKLVTPRGYPV